MAVLARASVAERGRGEVGPGGAGGRLFTPKPVADPAPLSGHVQCCADAAPVSAAEQVSETESAIVAEWK